MLGRAGANAAEYGDTIWASCCVQAVHDDALALPYSVPTAGHITLLQYRIAGTEALYTRYSRYSTSIRMVRMHKGYRLPTFTFVATAWSW